MGRGGAEVRAPWEPPHWLASECCPPYPVLKVYQIYAKRPAEHVHGLLRSFGTDYVILEDSICYERRHRPGCRLRDLLDLANGHVSVPRHTDCHDQAHLHCIPWNSPPLVSL